ncbi:hypothetical protein F4678DRAFT_453250 [Xylaria arbuscula]|nr:hypothetical protein F4678DRAFT_453250 [Xylaria arbuscula]
MGRNGMKAAYTVAADANKAKARNASFQKRMDTIFWKGNEMHEILGAEVYFVIKYRGQWYEYSSNPDLSFPLSRKDIHIDYPPVKATTPDTFVPPRASRIIKQPNVTLEAPGPKIASQPAIIPNATIITSPVPAKSAITSPANDAVQDEDHNVEAFRAKDTNDENPELHEIGSHDIASGISRPCTPLSHGPSMSTAAPATIAPYDQRRLAPQPTIGEATIVQPPVKRGRGRPRGSGRR